MRQEGRSPALTEDVLDWTCRVRWKSLRLDIEESSRLGIRSIALEDRSPETG